MKFVTKHVSPHKPAKNLMANGHFSPVLKPSDGVSNTVITKVYSIDGVIINPSNFYLYSIGEERGFEKYLLTGTQKVSVSVEGKYTTIPVPVWLYIVYSVRDERAVFSGVVNNTGVHYVSSVEEAKDPLNTIMKLVVKAIKSSVANKTI
ncbi:hypothetical protein A3L09_10755 (plasmid) [Thermococcus profundus]|uniref:Uncharacterized protein n=1 Tax=Thermococcus profundus TaxID=49899 RepID=A0A2Z2MB55_THEPR|nr:hypothetical protein [Thermococcus profundus]ASJ03830.1 hypothetical protein A3L09_10755 [Thermococcus profundus]